MLITLNNDRFIKWGKDKTVENIKMAGVERFELPTPGFGIRCSTNWSYTPKYSFNQQYWLNHYIHLSSDS